MFYYRSRHHRSLLSFPTRRSSDLLPPTSCMTMRTSLCGTPSTTARSDRKSTRLNSSHQIISYAVFCLKKKMCSETVPTPNEQDADEPRQPAFDPDQADLVRSHQVQ